MPDKIKNSIEQYLGLPRQMYILCVVRLINEAGMMFVFPFLALLLTKRLGYSDVEAGYLIILINGSNIPASLIGGKLADSLGRRRSFILLHILAIGLMAAAGFLSPRRIMLPFLAVGYAACVAIAPVNSATIVDISTPENRNECISLFNIFTNVGSALGPIVAGLLFYRYMSFIFFSVSILFGLSLILIEKNMGESYAVVTDAKGVMDAKEATDTKGAKDDGCALADRKGILCTTLDAGTAGHINNADGKPEGSISEYPGKTTPGSLGKNTFERSKESLLSVVLKSPALIAFLICYTLIILCYTNLSFTLPLQLSESFGLSMGSKLSSLLWTINGALCIILNPFIIARAKKYRPLPCISFGLLLYALGFGMYAFSGSSIPIFCLAAAVWTCGEILINTETTVFMAEKAPESHKGRIMSLPEVARSCAKSFGPAIFGVISDVSSYSFTWCAVSLLCILLSASIALLNRGGRR